MKTLLIITFSLLCFNVTVAQFNIKSKIKEATDKINDNKKDEKNSGTGKNTTTNSSSSNNQSSSGDESENKSYTYDSEGYIINHPDIMNLLKTKNKYYIVTKFNNSNWSPFLKGDIRPYDYAFIDQRKNEANPDIITYIPGLVHKIKDKFPNLNSSSVIHKSGASYPVEANKLYQCIFYIISFEADGGILYTELNDGTTGTFFYLAPDEASASLAATKYEEYKKKSDQNVEKVKAAEKRKQDEMDLSIGTNEYNNYFKPNYKTTSIEGSLISVANNESVVIQSELKKYGKITIKKIALLHQDWEVIKNSLGTPTHKQLDCYAIGTTNTGKCIIKCISFMKKYEGGSSYSSNIHIESECVPKPFSCDNIK